MTNTPIRTLTFGAISWSDPRLVEALYPEDAPPEWWLSCYASHFDTVLVPESDWRGAVASTWLESLPSQFWFYLRVETVPDAVSLAQLLDLGAKLDERLGGFVIEPTAAGCEAALAYGLPGAPVFSATAGAGAQRLWTGVDCPCPCGAVGRVQFEGRPSPRQLRAVLEGFLACQDEAWGVLFLDAPAQSFEEARVVGQLLGVS